MRRMINIWTDTEFNSFSIAIVAERVVGTLSVCTLEGPASYVVFSFTYSQEWEQRVVTWIVDLLCCAVGQVSPVGVNCGLLPRLENVLIRNSGLGAVLLVPLRLSDLDKSLVDVSVSVRVMGGTDVQSNLNHLQTRMKEFVRDPVLLACLKLLQVNICCVSVFILLLLNLLLELFTFIV